MIFLKLVIQEGLFSRTIDFSTQENLIYSQKNTKGKTTLMRWLLFALGFNIPNTKGINFSKNESLLTIRKDDGEEITLSRHSQQSIQIVKPNEEITFVLPEQQTELHKIIFGIQNAEVLENLLGTFYVDQEKGWTLLNRGVVVGNIRFNIESFIRGISGVDCSSLLSKAKILSGQLSKYRQMYNVADYKEKIQKDSGKIVPDNYDDSVDSSLNILASQLEQKKRELQQVDKVLGENKRFKKFISNIRLRVLVGEEEIEVTEDKIVGLNDSVDYLVAKRKIISTEFKKISKELEEYRKQKFVKEENTFFDDTSILREFDNRISKLPLNPVVIKNKIDQLHKELTDVRKSISERTKNSNSVPLEISAEMIKYATELNLGGDKKISSSYIFTSNLKELSGAVLHKTVFAFKLAYIAAVKKYLNIKLPIMLDSPSGKEVDRDNIQLMINVLKRDFSDHQIIVASIYNYSGFDNANVIEIKNRLIE